MMSGLVCLFSLLVWFCITTTNGKKKKQRDDGDDSGSMRWYVTTLDQSELFSRQYDLPIGNTNGNRFDAVPLMTILDDNNNNGYNYKQSIYGYGGSL